MNKPLRDLSTLQSVWLPVSLAALFVGLWCFYLRGYNLLTYKEGPVEWATVVAGLVGAGYGCIALARRSAFPILALHVLPAVLFVGLVYLAGEESSWGQHILHPRLPGQAEEAKNDGVANVDPRVKNAAKGEAREEARSKLGWFKRMNDQSETNLHNLPGVWGDLFGKLPKQMVEFGSIVACVAIPLFFRRQLKLEDPTRAAYWLMPTRATTAAAIIAFLLPWPKRIYESIHHTAAPTSLRTSETQEFFLALMLALYAASLALRLKEYRPAAATLAHAVAATAA